MTPKEFLRKIWMWGQRDYIENPHSDPPSGDPQYPYRFELFTEQDPALRAWVANNRKQAMEFLNRARQALSGGPGQQTFEGLQAIAESMGWTVEQMDDENGEERFLLIETDQQGKATVSREFGGLQELQPHVESAYARRETAKARAGAGFQPRTPGQPPPASPDPEEFIAGSGQLGTSRDHPPLGWPTGPLNSPRYPAHWTYKDLWMNSWRQATKAEAEANDNLEEGDWYLTPEGEELRKFYTQRWLKQQTTQRDPLARPELFEDEQGNSWARTPSGEWQLMQTKFAKEEALFNREQKQMQTALDVQKAAIALAQSPGDWLTWWYMLQGGPDRPEITPDIMRQFDVDRFGGQFFTPPGGRGAAPPGPLFPPEPTAAPALPAAAVAPTQAIPQFDQPPPAAPLTSEDAALYAQYGAIPELFPPTLGDIPFDPTLEPEMDLGVPPPVVSPTDPAAIAEAAAEAAEYEELYGESEADRYRRLYGARPPGGRGGVLQYPITPFMASPIPATPSAFREDVVPIETQPSIPPIPYDDPFFQGGVAPPPPAFREDVVPIETQPSTPLTPYDDPFFQDLPPPPPDPIQPPDDGRVPFETIQRAAPGVRTTEPRRGRRRDFSSGLNWLRTLFGGGQPPAARHASTLPGAPPFPSGQTVQRLLPSQRAAFQASVRNLGVPWQDYEAQMVAQRPKTRRQPGQRFRFAPNVVRP